MFKTAQIEDFEITDNILFNLQQEEALIYKLKIKHYVRSQKIYQLAFVGISLIFIFALFYFIIPEFFNNLLLVKVSALIFFPVCIIYLYKASKSLKIFIFVSNLKIYLIGETSPLIHAVSIIDLTSIGSVFIDYKNLSKDIGDIEFTAIIFNDNNEVLKKESFIISNIKNVSKIVQIIDSIIWYFAESNKRLETMENRSNSENYLDYFSSEQNSTIKLCSDKIVFTKNNIVQEINYTHPLHLRFERNFIEIKSFKEKGHTFVKFGPSEKYLEIATKIYLNYLSWKQQNGRLLDKKKIMSLQASQNMLKYRKDLNNKLTRAELELYKDNNKSLQFFIDYLDKNEQIHFTYFPKIILRSIVQIIFICLALIFLLIVVFSLAESLIWFFGACSIFILILSIVFVQKDMKYVFTSKKIIVKHKKEISFIFYSNIRAIIFYNKKLVQQIEIRLINPFIDIHRNKIDKFYIYSPKKLNLFRIIMSIKENQYSKN